MKKLMFTGCFVIINLLAASCKEKKTEAAAIPESVITAFKAKYPDVKDVEWEQEQKGDKTIFEGAFKINGKKTEADFDDEGKFIEEK